MLRTNWEGGKLHMCVRGIVIPMVPFSIGLWVVFNSTAAFVAIFFFSLAAFGHFRWCWGLCARLARFSETGKNAAALGLISSICYFFYHFFFKM